MKRGNLVIMLTVLIAMTFTVSSCKKSEVEPAKTSYNLGVKDVLGVSGTVTFIATSNTTATIEITLVGAPAGTHPAELRKNSAVEGGATVVTLNPVDATGKSSTEVTNLTYEELIAYDGYVIVHKGNRELDVILAVGDIGGNVLTTTKKSYELKVKDNLGVSGTALFEKRTNGQTLVTISLSGTIEGEMYPATINIGSVATVGGGDTKSTLKPVDGTTGKSYTNIKALDNDIPIKYEDWLVYVGYINIYQKSIAYDNIICQGNIGANVTQAPK